MDLVVTMHVVHLVRNLEWNATDVCVCVSGPVCGRDPSEDVIVNEEPRGGCEGSQRVSTMKHGREAR